jgi:hypothetical protein
MSVIKSEREHPTKLNDEQFARCWKVAGEFVAKNGSIRNKQLREVAGIGYDQAIGFFKRAVSEKLLVRLGSGSGTRYILKDKQRKDKPINAAETQRFRAICQQKLDALEALKKSLLHQAFTGEL